jgi:hypothetical protein
VEVDVGEVMSVDCAKCLGDLEALDGRRIVLEHMVERLVELVGGSAPLAWVSDGDADAAQAWERAAASLVVEAQELLRHDGTLPSTPGARSGDGR